MCFLNTNNMGITGAMPMPGLGILLFDEGYALGGRKSEETAGSVSRSSLLMG